MLRRQEDGEGWLVWVCVQVGMCVLPFPVNILVIFHGPAQVSSLLRRLPGLLQPALTSLPLNSCYVYE